MNLLDSMKYPQLARTIGFLLKAMLMPFMLLVVGSNSYAANVLYIDKSSGPSNTRQQLETAVNFYGLTMQVADFEGNGKDKVLLRSLASPELLAVVVNADALPLLTQKSLMTTLQRRDRQIPLLIAGISERTDPALLKLWSNGAIAGSAKTIEQVEKGSYIVAAGSEVTQQLGNARLPLITKEISYLQFSSGTNRQWLIKASSGSLESTVFARAVVDAHYVFFAAEINANDIPAMPDPYRQQAVFASVAPSMLFLHYAAGKHAWHSNASYANFTIDDLWLREPYGHVNYEGLLQHSQLHNFHSTIAFIPWNYDRSQPAMVSLFREHPDRLSICVHGNNHVHQEFGPLESHPLSTQSANMQQGLARMEKFSNLTGIPYDAVMVFPHSIAPEAIFAELKRHHYLATANSLNVPSDAVTPPGTDFALRTATLEFGNFPSLRRYSAETDIPRAQLAIDAFLGNPMLFYAHESYFAPGIDAFDKTADLVNTLQPTTQWQSLGSIVRHLYLERIRDDGDYDVQAFSSAIQITNDQKRNAVYHVDKLEDFSQPLKVMVDGKPYAFERAGSHLRVNLTIESGSSSEMVVKYGDDAGIGNVDIAKNSFQVNAIRWLSDFRDNAVSNTELGRRFIRSYADNGLKWNLGFGIILAILLTSIFASAVRLRRRGSQTRISTLIAPQAG